VGLLEFCWRYQVITHPLQAPASHRPLKEDREGRELAPDGVQRRSQLDKEFVIGCVRKRNDIE